MQSGEKNENITIRNKKIRLNEELGGSNWHYGSGSQSLVQRSMRNICTNGENGGGGFGAKRLEKFVL
jgi:hypothetical protein